MTNKPIKLDSINLVILFFFVIIILFYFKFKQIFVLNIDKTIYIYSDFLKLLKIGLIKLYFNKVFEITINF
jgi:hypothetical protein